MQQTKGPEHKRQDGLGAHSCTSTRRCRCWRPARTCSAGAWSRASGSASGRRRLRGKRRGRVSFAQLPMAVKGAAMWCLQILIYPTHTC